MDNNETIMKSFIYASAISRVGKAAISELLEKYAINSIEYYMLYYLEKKPGSTQYNLLKYTMQSKSRISQIINKLEKMGYIKKDLELVGLLLKKPLYITELGSEIVAEGIEAMYANTVAKLPPTERKKYNKYNDEMLKILRVMSANLDVEVPDFYIDENEKSIKNKDKNKK